MEHLHQRLATHGALIVCAKVLCRTSIEPESCVKQTETPFERWGAPSLSVEQS